jgi:hypothetical protein
LRDMQQVKILTKKGDDIYEPHWPDDVGTSFDRKDAAFI